MWFWPRVAQGGGVDSLDLRRDMPKGLPEPDPSVYKWLIATPEELNAPFKTTKEWWSKDLPPSE